MILYHNDDWHDDNAKLFEFNDRLRLGDGVFDTMLVLIESGKARIIHEALHRERLRHDAGIMGIEIAALPPAQHIIDKNTLSDGRYALNTLITRGIGERGVMPPKNAAPTITMRIAPAPQEFPPIHAIIAGTVRRNEGSPLSQIKSCNYGDNILALIEAQNKDANEAIMLNNKGHVTCASAGNIFACIDGALVTPPLSCGVMDGITRKMLIEHHGAIERPLSAQNLETANGLYITNSIRGASAVISLNGKTLPSPAITINKDFHIE